MLRPDVFYKTDLLSVAYSNSATPPPRPSIDDELGGGGWIRTNMMRVRSTDWVVSAPEVGLGPTTWRLTAACSAKLSYSGMIRCGGRSRTHIFRLNRTTHCQLCYTTKTDKDRESSSPEPDHLIPCPRHEQIRRGIFALLRACRPGPVSHRIPTPEPTPLPGGIR